MEKLSSFKLIMNEVSAKSENAAPDATSRTTLRPTLRPTLRDKKPYEQKKVYTFVPHHRR